MLQETQAIACEFESKAEAYDRLVIDRKDTKLTLFKGTEVVKEFAREKFLDSAMLVKGTGGAALFNILPNGDIFFTDGTMYEFMEKNCDDTGASKTCKTEQIKKLFWSPEKLQLKTVKENIDGVLDQYGYLANHATYFVARDRKKKFGASIALIDYGSALQMVVGPSFRMKCKYESEK